MDPRFGVLGPVQVRDSAGRQVSVGGPRPRALTCALVAEAGRVVSVDRLIDRVWGGEPPPAAVGTLYAYVSQLRKLLDPERRGNQASGLIATTGSGYLLHATPDEVDATLFERLIEEAESAPPTDALDKVDGALTLWRGEPYLDLGDSPNLAGLTQPLLEMRLRAFELRIGALLELGRTGPAASAARSLVREQPLREPYWRHLMMATYRDGHQADALAAYAQCRRVLDQELGMSPDAETEALHTAVLRRDPSLRPVLVQAPAVGPAVRYQPRAQAPPPPVGLETLIGREPQLAKINDALYAMASGSGWLIVLEGEAGIGKTRLAEAGRDIAEARGIRTVWSSTMPDMAAPPLWPWEQVLRGLGLPAPAAESPGDDPDTARFRLCQRIADTILEASRQQPLLVVLDDVHWADAPSLQVLRLLAAQLNRHRCVVVATRRTGELTVDPAVDTTVAALDREHTVRRVPIPPLTVDQVATLLDRYAAHSGADPAALHRRTGGNLFYLVELVRYYENHSAVGDGVPSSVQAVVEQRHDQLPEDTRTVLRLAALGGEELDLLVLAQARGLEPATVVAALEPAQSSGLLRREEQSLRWRFAHDIARQALVSRIGPSERARLHGELAEAITGVYGADSAEHLDDLAQHLFHTAHGTTSEAAFLACGAAADQARGWLAPYRAARHRERALAVLPAGDQSDRRHRTLLALSEERGMAGDNGGATTAIADALGTALNSARPGHGGGHPHVLEAAARFGGVTLWTWELPAPVEAMVITTLRGLLATELAPAQRATLLGALAQRLNLAGADRGEVERTARAGVDLAREVGDTALLGRALNNYVRAAWFAERELDRLAAIEEGLSLVGRGLPAATEIFARMHRMPILLHHGRLAECDRELAVSGELARSVSLPEAEAHATYHQITHALIHGKWATAGRMIDSAYRQFERAGFSHVEWCRVVQSSALALGCGRLGELAPELLHLGDTNVYGEPLRPCAVLALIEAGDPAAARQMIARWGLERVPETPSWATDFVTAELGEVAARLGTPDPAYLYDLLLSQRGMLNVLGTTMLCTGPVDLTLARLAHRLGRSKAASQHQDEAVQRYAQVPGFGYAFESVRTLLDGVDQES
ncbi:MAG TPA: BTAD domain-containing putative transcriptional regulator [Pseudonocardia sp.]|nr:BTAD domain-containing putative transcriptional regulator [Pseudonocardia sp.]